MSVEKERKAFEEQFVKVNHEIDFWSPTWDESINDYRHISASIGWRMWLQSSNREGYKLVPLEDTTDMWYEGNCVLDNGGSVSDIYKAMIGACDD